MGSERDRTVGFAQRSDKVPFLRRHKGKEVMAETAGQRRHPGILEALADQFTGTAVIRLRVGTPPAEGPLKVIPTELDLQKARIREFFEALAPDSAGLFGAFRRPSNETLVTSQIVVVLLKIRDVLAPGLPVLRTLRLPELPSDRRDDLRRHLVLKRPGVRA